MSRVIPLVANGLEFLKIILFVSFSRKNISKYEEQTCLYDKAGSPDPLTYKSSKQSMNDPTRRRLTDVTVYICVTQQKCYSSRLQLEIVE